MLLAFHAYRGMWRYVGVTDLMTLAKVSLFSSAILLIALPFLVRSIIVPRSVLAIDFLLFTFLLIGSRVSFAALNDTFARLQSGWLPRVLIVGAGDLGELVLRSMIRARPATYRPVGFLDPDPGQSQSHHAQLPRAGHARMTWLASPASSTSTWSCWRLPAAHAARTEQVREHCETLGLPAYAAATFVEMHFAGAPAIGAPSTQPALGDPDTPSRN